MKFIDLTIFLGKEERVLREKVKKIGVLTPKGKIYILPGHAESFVLLKKGSVEFFDISGKKREVEIFRGVMYVNQYKALAFV